MASNSIIPENELPIWMKQAQRGVDWGALLVIGFCLIAAWSFITEPNLPATNDTEHYVFQAENISQAFREGILYSRWSPYAIKGYGAPIPHYYPQGAAYLVAIVNILFTNDLVLATRLVYILSYIVAGSMVYALVAQRSHALYAVLAAVAYLFNPYFGLTVPHLLGDLPLMLGLALLPMIVWAVNRILLRAQAFDVVLLALITAIFVLTIPRLLPQAILFSLLVMGIHLPQRRDWRRIVWIGAGLFFGVGLAAFYWLPALSEIDIVEWHLPIMEAAPRFINFSQLFMPPNPLDSGFLLYETQFSLGWGLLILAALSFISLIIHRKDYRFHGGFLVYGIFLIVLLFFLPQTELLVGISLSLAIGGSYAGRLLQKRFGILVSFLGIVLILALAIPYWKVPPPALAIGATDANAQYSYEISGYGLAVLPAGSTIPSNISPSIEANFADDYSPLSDRVPTTNGQISLLEEHAYSGIYQVISRSPSRVNYLRSYFVGWEARLANQNLSLYPAPNGLMLLDIPANTNTTLLLGFGTTNLRLFAWVLSSIALFTSFASWWLRWRQINSDFDQSQLLSNSQSRLILLALFLSFLAHIIPLRWISLSLDSVPRSSLFTALYVRSEVDTRFQLLAFELPSQNYQAGDTFNLKLYWEVLRPILEQYQVRVRLVDSDSEETVLATRYTHPAYFPTNRWLASYVAPQTYEFFLPEDIAAGEYIIVVDAFRCRAQCLRREAEAKDATIQLRLSRSIIIE